MLRRESFRPRGKCRPCKPSKPPAHCRVGKGLNSGAERATFAWLRSRICFCSVCLLSSRPAHLSKCKRWCFSCSRRRLLLWTPTAGVGPRPPQFPDAFAPLLHANRSISLYVICRVDLVIMLQVLYPLLCQPAVEPGHIAELLCASISSSAKFEQNRVSFLRVRKRSIYTCQSLQWSLGLN